MPVFVYSKHDGGRKCLVVRPKGMYGKGVDFTEHNQERMMGFFPDVIRKQCIFHYLFHDGISLEKP